MPQIEGPQGCLCCLEEKQFFSLLKNLLSFKASNIVTSALTFIYIKETDKEMMTIK